MYVVIIVSLYTSIFIIRFVFGPVWGKGGWEKGGGWKERAREREREREEEERHTVPRCIHHCCYYQVLSVGPSPASRWCTCSGIIIMYIIIMYIIIIFMCIIFVFTYVIAVIIEFVSFCYVCVHHVLDCLYTAHSIEFSLYTPCSILFVFVSYTSFYIVCIHFILYCCVLVAFNSPHVRQTVGPFHSRS